MAEPTRQPMWRNISFTNTVNSYFTSSRRSDRDSEDGRWD